MLGLQSWFVRRVRNALTALWIFIWLHPLLSFIAIYLMTYSISLFQSFSGFSANLEAHSLSLAHFSPSYVTALNESISLGKPIQFNTTHNTNPTSIPRIIHRTFKSKDIPSEWKYSFESCEQQNPTYEQYFWTDESARDFIATHFDWFIPTYDAYPYNIQRVDAIRYFLLWHYGGIYIDMDIACRRPLDPLLEFSAWLPKTQPYGVSNDLMASAPGHPFITKLALGLPDYNRFYLSKYITVFFTTGPMYVNHILTQWFQKTRHGPEVPISIPHGVTILPSMMYDSTAYSFFGHTQGSTWHGSDVAAVSYLCRHWREFTLGAMASLSLVLAIYTLRIRRRTVDYSLLINRLDEEANHWARY
ncbi:nucleotide-diphospho-sugar transferase [Aspergillus avenaceus]|uniref:Nucleotide-diphospho-sugar transferase n=1 Tax=Aspergillus avenaceus TaxID=36643 RepID=A0A5N6TLC4_ASPAV|nr:nucleotide-diphospho-sugar transferase [Aspergillus avenaceus]